MNGKDLHVDIESQEDKSVLPCTMSLGKHTRHANLRKPDGSDFTLQDLLRLRTDQDYFAELLNAAIDRGDTDEWKGGEG